LGLNSQTVAGVADPSGAHPFKVVNFAPQINQDTFQVENLRDALDALQQFSVTDVVGVLRKLVEILRSRDIKGLNDPLPVINVTPNQLLQFADALTTAADQLLRGADLVALRGMVDPIDRALLALQAPAGQEELAHRLGEAFEKFKAAIGVTSGV